MNLNADVGESYGRFRIGNDAELIPYLDRCNIACGYHGGDPKTIIETVQMAIDNHASIGAHPSYNDLAGFGRRYVEMPSDDLRALIQYQLSALEGLVKMAGGEMTYVKPHGALYHVLLNDTENRKVIIDAIADYNGSLEILGFYDNSLRQDCLKAGLKFTSELFLDRGYDTNGRLLPRSQKGAVLTDTADVINQLDQWNDKFDIRSDEFSFCIHGDNPIAIEIAKVIRNLYPK